MSSSHRQKRIGHISFFYPPAGGGAERYLQRMIRACPSFEHHLWIARSTEEGTCPPDEAICSVSGYDKKPPLDYHALDRWLEREQKSLFNNITNWARSIDFDLLILNSPLTGFEATRELVAELKTNCPVGSIIHDVPGESFVALLAAYRQSGSWSAALEATHTQRLQLAKEASDGMFASPFHLEGDFTIYNSIWVRKFYDPMEELDSIVFHPLVEKTSRQPGLGLKPVDFTIVNPLPMKGGALFLALANFYWRDRRMRILAGGYNSALEQLTPYLHPVTSGFYVAPVDRNIELCGHIDNMSEVFRSTKLLVHPTRIEGFGMTAAEALLDDCLVATTDLPGVVEGVGDAALLMPYDAPPHVWANAVNEMLENREHWLAPMRRRATYLEERQEREKIELTQFLDDK